MTETLGTEETMNQDDFSKLLEESLDRKDFFSPGEKVTGTIVQEDTEHIFVDINGKSEAVLARSELIDDDGKMIKSIGDTIEAYVVSAKGGSIELTSEIGKGFVTPQILKIAYNSNSAVEGVVSEVVKGGFRIAIGATICFCPMSQIGNRKVTNPESLLGQRMSFKIQEYGERGRNIIVSHRILLDEQKKIKEEELQKTLTEGDTVQGTVQSIHNFGIFLNLGGTEALIPRSELGWSRQVKTSDYSVGQELSAQILNLDWKESKITASIKALSDDPWMKVESMKIGETCNASISNIIKTGAFAEITPGIEGFIHISRMSLIKRVKRPEEAVSIGDKVQVRILEIRKGEKKISLELITDEENPWLISKNKLTESIHSGIIEATRNNGLSIRLENGISGFLPGNELLDKNALGSDTYATGKSLKISIKDFNSDKRSCILSEKGAHRLEERAEFNKYMGSQEEESSSSLGNLFKGAFDDLKDKIKD